MAKLKPSEYPIGSWFSVPLPDGAHHAVGLIVAKPRRNRVEAVFFGPYDRPPTPTDAAAVTPGDAVQLVDGVTNYQFNAMFLADGSFPLLGTSDDRSTEAWFEPLDYDTYGGATIMFQLADRLTPGWSAITDPVVLSSWFHPESGRDWLASIEQGGGVDVLTAAFDECDALAHIPADASSVGFVAVELAARVVTNGRWKYGRMDELPEIEHVGYAEQAHRAGSWAGAVPEHERRDRELMAQLATDAERILDRLMERSTWVDGLRTGDPAGWDALAGRVAAVRAWLNAEWVLPKTWAQTLDEAMSGLDDELADEPDGPRGPVRPVSAGVDPGPRRDAMSWYRFDDVADWTAGPLQTDGSVAVRGALTTAIDDEAVDVQTIGVALAAADIVARLASGDRDEPAANPGSVEERVRRWVTAHADQPIDRNDVERARRVVGLARRGAVAAEMDGLDDESSAAWSALLDDLDGRLAAV